MKESKEGKRRRGRPSKVCLIIDKAKVKLADGRVIQFFKSRVRKYASSSGAYIPISQDHEDRQVIILVLDDGVDLE